MSGQQLTSVLRGGGRRGSHWTLYGTALRLAVPCLKKFNTIDTKGAITPLRGSAGVGHLYVIFHVNSFPSAEERRARCDPFPILSSKDCLIDYLPIPPL